MSRCRLGAGMACLETQALVTCQFADIRTFLQQLLHVRHGGDEGHLKIYLQVSL